MTGSDTTFPYGKTEKDFLIVACVKAADNSATFTRKNQDQGLIFSNETQRGCLRPMLLSQEVFIPNVPSFIYEKRRKTSYSSMRESSRKSATFTRKNQDHGLIFRHETRIFARLLPSYATIKEVFRSQR